MMASGSAGELPAVKWPQSVRIHRRICHCMIALIQRVTMARVQVAGRTQGEIGAGLLALIGVEQLDGPAQAQRLLERMLDYRVFPDDAGRMKRSLRDTAGGLLLVPQVPLGAATPSGHPPGFSPGAA